VNPRSGAVTVAVNADVNHSLLDRETSDTLDVLVMASDARNHSSVTQLTVHLSDVNDNRPVFRAALAGSNVGVISENSLVFTWPLTVVVCTQRAPSSHVTCHYLPVVLTCYLPVRHVHVTCQYLPVSLTC